MSHSVSFLLNSIFYSIFIGDIHLLQYLAMSCHCGNNAHFDQSDHYDLTQYGQNLMKWKQGETYLLI